MQKSTFDRCISNRGVVNRTSRTEFAMFVKTVDATTGASVAVGYTGLRNGSQLCLASWCPVVDEKAYPTN